MRFLLLLALLAPTQSRPLVVPFMEKTGDGPAFVVECVNDSGAELSSRDGGWLEALRLNGEVLKDPEGGTAGSGGSTPIPAGQTWRGMVVLLQTGTGNTPAHRVGEVVRLARLEPLPGGKHTFAVRCRGHWSADVPFYWSTRER